MQQKLQLFRSNIASIYGAEIAKERFGLENVYAVSFEDFLKRTDLPSFDIITFFEVIEHLDKPLEFILSVKRLLNP